MRTALVLIPHRSKTGVTATLCKLELCCCRCDIVLTAPFLRFWQRSLNFWTKTLSSLTQRCLFWDACVFVIYVWSLLLSFEQHRCRCGRELTSIGCLMTALFVWCVSTRKALMWQEIAAEEDWTLYSASSFSLFLSHPFACLSCFIP